jgi:hypothetical protein
MLAEPYRLEENLPITDELFADVVSLDQASLFALIAKLSPDKRALLAMYCYRRSHLSEIGLAIAATCDEDDLTFTCGRAGADLFSKSRERPRPAVSAAHPNSAAKLHFSGGICAKCPPSIKHRVSTWHLLKKKTTDRRLMRRPMR